MNHPILTARVAGTEGSARPTGGDLMPTVFPDKLGRRRLKRLLNAHEEKAFEGTIPWDCAEAIAAHEQIDREYERARQMMLEHLDRQALEIVDLRERLRSAENRKPR